MITQSVVEHDLQLDPDFALEGYAIVHKTEDSDGTAIDEWELQIIEQHSENVYRLYRVSPDLCYWTQGADGKYVLSDNEFHKFYPVWFADVLKDASDAEEAEGFIERITSPDPHVRAREYWGLTHIHSVENFDGYPLEMDAPHVLRWFAKLGVCEMPEKFKPLDRIVEEVQKLRAKNQELVDKLRDQRNETQVAEESRDLTEAISRLYSAESAYRECLRLVEAEL